MARPRPKQQAGQGYTDEELEVILRFMTEAARRQQEATANSPGSPGG